jgi:hypothetical protein
MQSTLRTLAVAVALVVMFGCSVDLRKQLPEPVTLNADDYRPEITDIDRLLFSPKPYDDARSYTAGCHAGRLGLAYHGRVRIALPEDGSFRNQDTGFSRQTHFRQRST